MGAGPLRLVLATANPGKVEEITEILRSELGSSVEVLPRPSDIPDIPEEGSTLEANARIKAEAICLATGESALADDTGLEVEALGGAPGVHSARFAGEDASDAQRVDKLLRALEEAGADTPPSRAARFRTAVLLRFPGGREMLAEGVVEGRIAERPVGEAGFGYDPVFVPHEGDGRSFAQMTPTEKHQLSHRGRAVRALAEGLARLDRQIDGA